MSRFSVMVTVLGRSISRTTAPSLTIRKIHTSYKCMANQRVGHCFSEIDLRMNSKQEEPEHQTRPLI